MFESFLSYLFNRIPKLCHEWFRLWNGLQSLVGLNIQQPLWSLVLHRTLHLLITVVVLMSRVARAHNVTQLSHVYEWQVQTPLHFNYCRSQIINDGRMFQLIALLCCRQLQTAALSG